MEDAKAVNSAPPPLRFQKQRWAPTRYRTEAPAPPVVDHRLEEEAAAHQAAQDAGYEGRRVRKFLQRRTVDWNEGMSRWKLERALRTGVREDHVVRPGVNHIVELLPSAAYRSSAQAVTTNMVHSSTNKIRCPVNIVRVRMGVCRADESGLNALTPHASSPCSGLPRVAGCSRALPVANLLFGTA